MVAFEFELWFHRGMDEAAVSEQLRATGIKVTRGRVRVLSLLQAAPQPLSHGDIETMIEASLDRVTLYRILDSLVTCGLALKAVDPRGVFRFSSAAPHHRHEGHVHFRCTDCGGVFCLKAAPPPPPRLPRGFRLAEVAYDLRGVCATCVRGGGR